MERLAAVKRWFPVPPLFFFYAVVGAETLKEIILLDELAYRIIPILGIVPAAFAGSVSLIIAGCVGVWRRRLGAFVALGSVPALWLFVGGQLLLISWGGPISDQLLSVNVHGHIIGGSVSRADIVVLNLLLLAISAGALYDLFVRERKSQ